LKNRKAATYVYFHYKFSRAVGEGRTEAAAREAAYRNLVSRLVPASYLSCLTELMSSLDVNGFRQHYAHLLNRTKDSIGLDIFSGRNMEELLKQVTAYAAGYAGLTASLIRSLLPDRNNIMEQRIRVECRLDPLDTLWTSEVSLGIYEKKH
jgi:hypothetical protein